MLESIISEKGDIIAQVLRAEALTGATPGTHFLTNGDDETLQMGVIKYDEKRTKIPTHYHPREARLIKQTSEVLCVIKGSIVCEFIGRDCWEVQRTKINAGDFLLILQGWHGVTLLDPETVIVEIKQGPYLKGLDKVIRPDQ